MKKTVCLLFLILMYACTKEKSFNIKEKENPWPDDYTSISSIKHYKKWGPYNVHDPAVIKVKDFYYMFSTDAILGHQIMKPNNYNVPEGYIQIRKSKDLIHWDFVGWAFNEIPKEAALWVRKNTNGKGATNIWAPYVIKEEGTFRLYYSVSAFGKSTSYIGLAESSTITGPWNHKGCVVKTIQKSEMNAIDPSVIKDKKTGKTWMHYGSYFGGLYCVELNTKTGLTLKENDKGHLIARRANYKKDNLEAPEIIYNKKLKKYFLFTSYDPLMTTYNIRVAQSDFPEGPFFDFFNVNIKDTTNNFPIITSPYKFNNHEGWAGVAHCGVFEDGEGNFFMTHQGRLSPDNHQMVLHVRELFFTPTGWPIASPQRYTGTPKREFKPKDINGEWEIIRILEPNHERMLEAGQVLWGEGSLHKNEWNTSSTYVFQDGNIIKDNGTWSFDPTKQVLFIHLNSEPIDNLIIFAGHDWENQTETILFTGLDSKGRSIWGKRIK